MTISMLVMHASNPARLSVDRYMFIMLGHVSKSRQLVSLFLISLFNLLKDLLIEC